MVAMKIEDVKIGELRPYEKNARTHPESQIKQIARSIEEFGFNNPILATADGRIIAGHGRIEAAKMLGLQTVPVVRIEHLSQEQIQAYTLADNQLALTSRWDADALANEIRELYGVGFDLDLLGFDPSEMAGMLEVQSEIDESLLDEVPEVEEIAITKPGDLWQLGDHRLLCGDSTKSADVALLMGGEKAQAWITDPPYGVSYKEKNDYLIEAGKGRQHDGIESDQLSEKDLKNFWEVAVSAITKSVYAGAPIYITAPPGPLFEIFGQVLKAAGLWRSTLVWVKNNFVLGRSDYKYQHEAIFYGWFPGAAHPWYGEMGERTVIDDRQIADSKKLKKEELIELVGQLVNRLKTAQTDVIDEDKPHRSEDHPTMKPIKLFARFVGNSTKAGDIIFDGFLGSGTTLIAAEQLGRRCRGIEILPQYCDVVIKRWQKLTGKRALNLNTGDYFEGSE